MDTDAHVDSSDVSLAEYLCTHGCLSMFLQRDFSLTSSSTWASMSSLGIPDRGLVPLEGLVDR